MEQKFGINSLDLQVLREFCEHEGKMVESARVTNWSVRVTQRGGLPSSLKDVSNM